MASIDKVDFPHVDRCVCVWDEIDNEVLTNNRVANQARKENVLVKSGMNGNSMGFPIQCQVFISTWRWGSEHRATVNIVNTVKPRELSIYFLYTHMQIKNEQYTCDEWELIVKSNDFWLFLQKLDLSEENFTSAPFFLT